MVDFRVKVIWTACKNNTCCSPADNLFKSLFTLFTDILMIFFFLSPGCFYSIINSFFCKSLKVRRKNFIGTRWIKTCGWYPDYLVRIYRHDKLKYPEVKAHAAVPHDNTHRLNADIEHRTYSSITEMFAKQIEKFSTRSAKILYEKGRKISPFAPFFHGMHTFFLNYFIRKGFLGGIDGLSISIAMAVNSYLKYAKVIEWQRNPEMTETEDFNNSLW